MKEVFTIVRPFSVRMSTLTAIVGLIICVLAVHSVHAQDSSTSASVTASTVSSTNNVTELNSTNYTTSYSNDTITTEENITNVSQTQPSTTTTFLTTTAPANWHEHCGLHVNSCKSNLTCINGICDCNTTVEYYEGSSVLCKLKKGRYENCNSTNECKNGLTCNGTCNCTNDEYFDANNAEDYCQTKKGRYENCNSTNECKNGLTCNGTCNCTNDEYFDANNAEDYCQTKKGRYENCNSTNECKNGLTCNGTCNCTNDEYFDANNAEDYCQTKKGRYENCNSTNECKNGLTCNGTCNCTNDEYFDANNAEDYCQTKKGRYENCNSTNECKNGLTCNGTCNCTNDEYFDANNAEDYCQTIRGECPELNYTATCDGIKANDVCKDLNTECVSYSSSTKKCLCKENFYRSDNQVCVSVSKLKINASSERKTTYIYFSWDDTSERKDIIYNITWNKKSIPANESKVNVTGLAPGTQYSFTITSALNDKDYNTFTEYSNYTLWTLPAKPGVVKSVMLVSSSSSLHYNYEIIFGVSEGAVSYYKLDVTGAGDVSISMNSTSENVTLQLTPSAYYNYTLKSVSDKPEESEPVTGTFRANATVAGPVQNLSVTGVMDFRANITWQKPVNPNGNVTGYLVKVLNETGYCMYYTKVTCNGCTNPLDFDDTNCSLIVTENTFNNELYKLELSGLEPYNNYTVVVMAVNEKGLGHQSDKTFQTDVGVANQVKDITLNSTRDENTKKVNLIIIWTPGKQTGPTTYYICIQKEELSTNNCSTNMEDSNKGYHNTTFVKKEVIAFWNYSVSIIAETSEGRSPAKSKYYKTVESNPGIVKNLTLTQDSVIAKNVTVNFLCPEEQNRNGIITRFVIKKSLLNDINNSVESTDNYTVPAKTPCSDNSFIDKNVTVERNYSFAVLVVNSMYEGDFSKPILIKISARDPQLKKVMEAHNVQYLVQKSAKVAPEETKITVEVCAKCLTDESQGRVTKVGLIVCVKGQLCEKSERKRRSADDYLSKSNGTWKNAKANDFKNSYITTPDNWINTLKGFNAESVPFTIGENTSCVSYPESVYCNGPLPPGKELIITPFVCNSAGCDNGPSAEIALKSSTDDISGAIIGAVLGGLAFIIIVVCIILFIIWRYRRRHGKPTRSSHTYREMEDKTKEIKQKRPVTMRHFGDHVARFHKDSNLLFQDEYEGVQNLSKTFTFPSEQAKLEHNRVKNRYVDIIPYDHSRVKLDILQDDDEAKDFINANYIPGYNSVREYIATQGPMYSTIPDFWRMVWEQKCKVIVMLSDLMEEGKRKVDLYWPENLNEPINYEHVVVEMTNFSQLNKYVIRNFKITKGDEVRRITHFFLPGWSDFSASIGIDSVLGFVKLVRQEATPANPGPIIVHCSAGVGRTGTLIALDYFIQFVEKHSLDDEVDIFDFVMQMRRNRCRMVQVENQYILICDAVNKVIQEKIKAEEERIYENTGSNGVYANLGQEENIYQNSSIKEDKYVYNNEAFEPDFSTENKKNGKPTTEL